jgi:DNA-binding winged helix-turn-helix (wHTH) protein
MAMIANELYRFDDFELQPSRRYLLRAGEKVALAPKTFEVLLCLVQRPGQVVLKEELLRAVWPDSFVEESNLTQHVFWLRKALGDKSGYVVTIPGRGYEFIGKVHAVPEAGSVAGPVAGPVAGSVAGPVAGPEAAPVVVSVSLQQTVEHTEIVFEESSIAAPRRVRWRPALAAGLAVAAALGGWGWTHWLHRPFAGDRHEVVLADFENTSGDAGFDSALKTLLAIDLNESPFLTVAGGTDVKQVLQLMQHRPDEALTPAVAREVCQRMNDQVVIGGEIARFGQKYLVALSASDCASGRDLARTKAVADSRGGPAQAAGRAAQVAAPAGAAAGVPAHVVAGGAAVVQPGGGAAGGVEG